MPKHRQKVPHAVLDEFEIYGRTGKRRKKSGRKHLRPLCSRCGKFCYVQHTDHGHRTVIDTGETKRGRPRKKAPRKTWKKRREHIGYWCDECKVFYYPDGSPDWRGIT